MPIAIRKSLERPARDICYIHDSISGRGPMWLTACVAATLCWKPTGWQRQCWAMLRRVAWVPASRRTQRRFISCCCLARRLIRAQNARLRSISALQMGFSFFLEQDARLRPIPAPQKAQSLDRFALVRSLTSSRLHCADQLVFRLSGQTHLP